MRDHQRKAFIKMSKIKDWFVAHKDWFNPMPEYTAKLAMRDRTKRLPPLPSGQDIYRLFTGCLYAESSPPYKGRHLGLFDYLTFGIFYGIEAFLRGHWKEPGPAQDKMKKYLIPLWGPLNILRAVAGMSVMVVLMAPVVALAIPLMILAGIALLGVKIYIRCADALAPWKERWAQKREEKRVAKEERTHVHSPAQRELDKQKINLRNLNKDPRPYSNLGQSTAWIITKTVVTVDGIKTVSYAPPRIKMTDEKIKSTKWVYEGTTQALKEIKQRILDQSALSSKKRKLEFKEKKPRIGAPNRLVVRIKGQERSREDDRTTTYTYQPANRKK
jgi:hypothetical protein